MKKNIIFLLLSMVFVLSLVMIGCSSAPSSAPPPSTAQAAPPPSTIATPSMTPAQSVSPTASHTASITAKVYTLKYSGQNPENGWDAQHADAPYLAAITKATNGQVQFQNYYSQSLAKGPDTWNAVENGVADMGWMVQTYWADMTPLADVAALPFLGIKSAAQASGIIWQLYAKYPTLASEFSTNHVLVL